MTTTYVLHDRTGVAVSIGTVVADPLPAGLTAVPLSDADAGALVAGTGAWDSATRTVIPAAPIPDQRAELLARLNESPLTLDDIKAVVVEAITQGVI